MLRYTVLVFREPDGRYSVEVPTLDGCVTQGDSLEEAIAMAREAIAGYLESLAAHGEPIPREHEPPHVLTLELGEPTPPLKASTPSTR
ncbi:MAG TPA: type II toxin-antitoxin system HicB family antitoxin [Dehalococcoidia bacterium]|nr:type II toxin-antitoxin system HicB family antitoxin [Dehalococcoidia bacterium]